MLMTVQRESPAATVRQDSRAARMSAQTMLVSMHVPAGLVSHWQTMVSLALVSTPVGTNLKTG